MKFKNMKFIVRDEDHSRQIQEALFAAGYKWYSNRGIEHLDSKYLYTNNYGLIQYGTDKEFFEVDKSKVSILLDITNPIETCQEKHPTINIGGNLYLVSDVEYALKNLKKIGE